MKKNYCFGILLVGLSFITQYSFAQTVPEWEWVRTAQISTGEWEQMRFRASATDLNNNVYASRRPNYKQ